MQANSWHHILFDFHLSFWIWKVCKEREIITEILVFREWKKLFRCNKKHFSQFLKGYHLVKKLKSRGYIIPLKNFPFEKEIDLKFIFSKMNWHFIF